VRVKRTQKPKKLPRKEGGSADLDTVADRARKKNMGVHRENPSERVRDLVARAEDNTGGEEKNFENSAAGGTGKTQKSMEKSAQELLNDGKATLLNQGETGRSRGKKRPRDQEDQDKRVQA